MHKNRIKALFVVIAVFGALPALAAEGRTPVYLDGTIIGTDGDYVLTRDIVSAGAGVPVITISAPNVDLDLNGFTLFQAAAGPAVIDIAGLPERVRIHNGKLVGGTSGIDRVVGLGAGQMVIVEDVRVVDASGPAIHLGELNNVAIRRCHIQDAPAGPGILIDPPGFFTHGIIEKNHIRRTAGGIHVLTGSSMNILDNTLEVINPPHGILVEDNVGCMIARNTISDVFGSDGIHLNFTRGCKIYNNVVRHAEVHGIDVDPGSSDNLLLDNVVSDSGLPLGGGFGMFIEGARNHVERNTVNANGDCGIWFTGPDNAYGRNMARGNGFVAASCGPCAAGLFPPDSCDDAPGNTSFGDNYIPLPLF